MLDRVENVERMQVKINEDRSHRWIPQRVIPV